MADSDYRNCQTCGKEFKKSRNDYTVNCPECRAKKSKFKAGGKTYTQTEGLGEPDNIGGYRCKTCGVVFPRGQALRHRNDTGHKF